MVGLSPKPSMRRTWKGPPKGIPTYRDLVTDCRNVPLWRPLGLVHYQFIVARRPSLMGIWSSCRSWRLSCRSSSPRPSYLRTCKVPSKLRTWRGSSQGTPTYRVLATERRNVPRRWPLELVLYQFRIVRQPDWQLDVVQVEKVVQDVVAEAGKFEALQGGRRGGRPHFGFWRQIVEVCSLGCAGFTAAA